MNYVPLSSADARHEARSRLLTMSGCAAILLVYALVCWLSDLSRKLYEDELVDEVDDEAQRQRDADALSLELQRVAEARAQPTIDYPPHPAPLEFPKPRAAVVDPMTPHDQPPSRPVA